MLFFWRWKICFSVKPGRPPVHSTHGSPQLLEAFGHQHSLAIWHCRAQFHSDKSKILNISIHILYVLQPWFSVHINDNYYYYYIIQLIWQTHDHSHTRQDSIKKKYKNKELRRKSIAISDLPYTFSIRLSNGPNIRRVLRPTLWNATGTEMKKAQAHCYSP